MEDFEEALTANVGMGGIAIDYKVLVGPKVNLFTENQLVDPAERKPERKLFESR